MCGAWTRRWLGCFVALAFVTGCHRICISCLFHVASGQRRLCSHESTRWSPHRWLDGRKQSWPVNMVGQHEPAINGPAPSCAAQRIQPEAKADEAGPNRRVHGVPCADGGATISAVDQSTVGPASAT